MKYLRKQNLNFNNVLDNTVLQTADGNIELNPTHRVVINGDIDIIGGNVPGPEVTNVMYVTVDGNDANTGYGEGANQAKRTIKSAVLAAQEGTTIFVRSGEYYENNPIRLPPKVSIIGDNLRRTILRPLNGPSKFNVVSIQRTDGIVTLTTDQPHEFQLHDRVRVIITNPIGAAEVDDECANIIEITSSTSFTYKDFGINLPLTPVVNGIVEKGIDFFLCTSQTYIAQLVFRGLQAPSFCVNIDKDAIVDTSPYIQNCSNINGPWLRNGVEWLPFITEQPDLTGTMVKGPRPLRDDEINPAQLETYSVNQRGAGGGMLIDGDRYNSESPIKSMVADAFTQVAQGAVGFHITNFGYMQLVSCFNVFCDKAYLTTKGGYLSISNSVCDFGNYAFYADGYYPTPYGTGTIVTDYYSTLGSVTVNDLGSGYTSVPIVTVQIPDPGVVGGIQATAVAFIDIFKGTVNAIAVDNPGFGYEFEPIITVSPPITGATLWVSSLTVTTSDTIQYDRYFYQVTVDGTLGTTPPSDVLIPQVNGTATLQRIASTATATANLAKNGVITVSNVSSKPQIASIMFLGNDPIGYYITDTLSPNLGFTYNETKCRRDVGYITDAVMADAVFGTNFRSIYAGVSYLRSQASKVTSLQKAETIAGLNQARDYILSLPTVAGNATVSSRITANFLNVTNIIQNGTSAISTPILPQLAGQTAGLTEAAQVLLSNKQYLQDEIIAYINANFVNDISQGFKYDEVKCARDVGIILESVLSDLILGTNYLSKISGLSYLRSYSNEVTQYQKIQTIDGINRARELAIQLITDLDTIEIINTNFEIVKKIIREGSKTAAPVSVYTNPIGTTTGTISSARQLEINRNFIVEEIVAYVKDTFNTNDIIGYNENLCRRDTEYIVDALIFDILYSGNVATRIVAQSFYDEDGNNVVGTQLAEHAAAFTRLKTVVEFVIQDSTSWVKSVSNPLTQNITLSPGTDTVIAKNLIDVIINSIQIGVGSVPSQVLPTYSNGSLYSYYNDERLRILTDNITIQNSVIDYLNTKYSSNFTYNEATCRRDIGYIIDAISYDLTYGGNTQTTNASLSYSDYSVILDEVETTQASFEYWKTIIPYVLQNQDVPNAYAAGQVKTTPIGNPVPEYYPSTISQNLLQIVIDTVDHGPGYVPEPVTESRFDLANSTFNAIRLEVLDQMLAIQDSTIGYLNSTYGGNIDVKVFPGIISVASGTEVRFHNVSTISTGGTALEYVGAGVTYNALPFFGGEPTPENERVEINNGKCFTVTNDQVGNFRVGGLFNVNALTGGVTINANQLSLQGLSSIGPFIRDGIPVGVELREVSNSTNLIASNGLQDILTVPTQYAVSNYVEDRYLNKVQSGVPQTVESDVAFIRDVEIRGADLTTDQLTFNLLNDTATTVNFIGDASIINMGADTGTLTIGNPNVIGTQSIQNLYNAVATTVNTFGVATGINVGINAVAASTLRFGPTITGNTFEINSVAGGTVNLSSDVTTGIVNLYTGLTTGTVNVATTGASTTNIGGAAAVVNIGNTSGNSIVEIRGNSTTGIATLRTNAGTTTGNVFDTQITTGNLFGSANDVNIATAATAGASTLTFGGAVSNNTFEINSVAGGTVNLSSDVTTGIVNLYTGITTGTINVATTGASTTNIGGADAVVNIGNTSGNSTLTIRGNATTGSATIVTNALTANVFDIDTTTVNAFGVATTIDIGATTGTLTINNNQTVFNSVDSIQIPVGTTAQRDPTPVTGQIRYNTTNSSFEGFGPGDEWGSLGGVKDVDGNTYIIAELTPAANDNTLWFYNDGVETLTITKTDVDFKDDVVVTINNLTDSTNSTTGALKVLGGVMIAKDLFVGGGDIITDELTFNLLNTIPTTINAFDNATDVNISNVTTGAVTVDIATAATGGASTLTFGGAVSGNTFDINSIATGTVNLSSDVTTGTVNLYTGLTTGIMNIGSGNTGRVVVAFTTNSTTSTNGALVVSGGVGIAKDIVGAGFITDGGTGAVTTANSSIKSFVIDEGEY